MIEENLDKLVGEAKEYADLQIKSLKLQAAGGLAVALSNALGFILVMGLVLIILGILGLALLQWLNLLLGAPWGTLIVACIFLFLLVWVLFARKNLFRDMFVKLIVEALFEDED